MDRRRLLPSLVLLAVLAAAPLASSLATGRVLSFRDHFDYFVPLRHFTAEVLRGGHLPLWNPYNASGEPWLANPQTGVFYPPAWIFLVVPFARAYALFLLFHLALTGVGAFFLFRRWSSDGAALLAAAGLTLCGPVMSLLDVNNNLATFAWFPLVILSAAERGEVAPRIPRSAGAVAIALMFLGGEPYLALVGAVLWMVSYLTLAARVRISDLVVVPLMSILLCGVQLLPFLELLGGSERALGLDPAAAFRQSADLADWTMAALSPVVASGQAKLFQGSQQFIPVLYIGLPMVLGVAGASMVLARRGTVRRLAVLWGGILAVSAVIAAAGHLPFIEAVLRAVRFTSVRHPSRMLVVGALALAGLAAIGFDELGKRRLAHRLGALVIAAATAAAAWVLFLPAGSFDGRGLSEQLSILALCALAACAPALARRPFAPLIAAAVVGADLLVASAPLFVTTSFPPAQPYREVISPHRKFLRMEPAGGLRWSVEDRVRLMSGYLNLLGRKFDLSTAAPVISARYDTLEHLVRSGRRRDLADFLSTGYLISPVPMTSPGLQLVPTASGAHVYENDSSMPMVSVWGSGRKVGTDREAVEMIAAGKIDARRELLIRDAEPSRASAPPDARMSYMVSPEETGIAALVSRPAIIVLNQRTAPGWSVRVDGRRSTALVADGMFRAVAVGPGKHQIEWTYHPWSLRAGLIFSVAGVLAALSELAWRRRSGAGITPLPASKKF